MQKLERPQTRVVTGMNCSGLSWASAVAASAEENGDCAGEFTTLPSPPKLLIPRCRGDETRALCCWCGAAGEPGADDDLARRKRSEPDDDGGEPVMDVPAAGEGESAGGEETCADDSGEGEEEADAVVAVAEKF